jgi:MoaA/NifB/PqqE/SkfB family radical SAM enzyme
VRRLLRRAKRVFDSRPIAAHLYVTERCNLRCAYCTEYDNSVPHPALADVRRWIDRLRDLGCLRIGLQGGEPLLHPDIAAIVRHVRESGMGCSLATNGFLLSAETVCALEEAGLEDLHVSVDQLAPTPESRKCLSLLDPKLDLLRGSRLRTHVTAVLYGGSVDQLPGLFAAATARGFSFKAHLVHRGTHGAFTVEPGERERLLRFLDWEIAEKRRGRPVRHTFAILDYQRALLTGECRPWTCLAGYKYLFVSARGTLWTCSMNRSPGVDLLSVTPATLRAFNRPKPCQPGCGVYCVVVESLVNDQPLRFLAGEIGPLLAGRLGLRR